MNWMNSRKVSWACFGVIAIAIVVPFSISSCDVPATTIASVPTDTSVPTPVPSPTPTPQTEAVVAVDFLNLRAGPGTNYDILTMMEEGTRLKMVGRTEANDWLKVVTADGREGWVWAEMVDASGDLGAIAVAQAPAAPTPLPSPTPEAPTATDTLTNPYPALTLANPASGATIMGEKLINFSWRWDGALQERERFDLRIWRLEKPSCTIAMARENSVPLDTPPDGFGQYQWQVAVVRIDESGNKSSLSESQIWPFVWIDVPPTSTPTATPTPTPIPDAAVNAENLNLRSGPGTVYDRLGVLEQGDPLKVTSRNLAGDWLKVIAPDGQEGWVAASLLEINVPLAGLATAQAPPTPTSIYTPTPTVTPTPELLLAPTLLEPKAGEGDFSGWVVLKWRWERPLEKDEYFSVRVRSDKKGECHHTQVQEPAYLGGLSYCPSGEYYWQVAVVRKLCEDCPNEQKWQTVSQPSEDWLIRYQALDKEGGPGPEPKEPGKEPPK